MFTGGSKYSVYIILKTCQSLNIFCTSFLSLCCSGLFLALHIYWQAVLTPGVSALFASPDHPDLAKCLLGSAPNPLIAAGQQAETFKKSSNMLRLTLAIDHLSIMKAIAGAAKIELDEVLQRAALRVRIGSLQICFRDPMFSAAHHTVTGNAFHARLRRILHITFPEEPHFMRLAPVFCHAKER